MFKTNTQNKSVGLIVLLLLLIFSVNNLIFATHISDVDFMESQSGHSKVLEEILRNNENNIYDGVSLAYLRKHYLAKSPSKMPYNKDPLIPKIIHQIWIGTNEIPPLYKQYYKECKLLHPDYEFKLWTEKDIIKFYEQYPQYKKIYDISRTPIQKSDMFRYAILLQYGGIYRDMDVKCYRNLDELNHKYDFYTMLVLSTPQFNNGFIGSSANHPIIKDVLETISTNLPAQLEQYDKEHQGEKFNIYSYHSFTVNTSMQPLTTSFGKIASYDDKALPLPISYSFPIILNPEQHCITAREFPVQLSNNLSNFLKVAQGRKVPDPLPFAQVGKEALIFHNFPKHEVGYIEFDEGMDFNDPARYRMYKNLSTIEKDRLNNMRENYNTFNCSKVSFKNTDEIPQKLIFITFNNQEEQELKKHIPDWVMFNRTFTIENWNKDKIIEIAPHLEPYLANTTKYTLENVRFIAGLEIINKTGGHYIDFRIKPINPVFELGNKYKLYFGLQPINKKNMQVIASHRIIGSTNSNPILSEVLDEFYTKGTAVNWSLPHFVYKNMHSYGPVVVLPTSFVGPADPIGNWYTTVKKIYKGTIRSHINERHAWWSIVE